MERTRYFDGDSVDLKDVPTGSLLAMYSDSGPLVALTGTGRWIVVKSLIDVDLRGTATILRRTG